MVGGLHDPLGTDRPAGPPGSGPSLFLITLAGVLIGFACLFAAAAYRNSAERGEPRAVAEIGPAHHMETVPSPPPPIADASRAAGPAPPSDQDIAIENGVRVVRLRHGGTSSGNLVVKVPAPMPGGRDNGLGR